MYDLLSFQTVVLPPLRKRKKDIRMIVDELIRRNNMKLAKQVRGTNEDAYKALMGYEWPGNTEELSVAIRRAVSIARGDMLMPEDIFFVPPPVTGKFTINLLKYPQVMRVFQSRFFPQAGVLVTAPFIVLLIYLGLFGPQSADRNVTSILAWGYWEPLLVISAFFTARMWCSICPVRATGNWVRRVAGLHLKAPLLIRNQGFYFAAAGIAVIIWAETATGMLHSPRATGLLVLSMVILSSISGLLFQRSAWCRYLCPLGCIVGTLSNCSVLELRSNYEICNNVCKKHDCYSGGEKHAGCPMFEGPFSLNSNQNCILCAKCIKICPNESPVLNLRLPGYDLWTLRTPEKSIMVAGTTLIGTQLFRGFEKALSNELAHNSLAGSWFGTLILLTGSIFLAALYSFIAGHYYFRKTGPGDAKGWYRIVYVLLPLVFAFEAGYHIERLLTMGGQILPVLGRQLGITAALPYAGMSPAGVKAIQFFLVILGYAGSTGVLRKILRTEEGLTRPRKLSFGQTWPAPVLTAVYLWMFLAG